MKPAEVNQWNGPYMPQDIPKDPWGREYIYKYPGEHGDEPDIISLGADGQPGGEGSMPTSSAGRTNSRGITLMEMLVVVAIIGLIVAVSAPSISAGLDSVRITTTADDHRQLPERGGEPRRAAAGAD